MFLHQQDCMTSSRCWLSIPYPTYILAFAALQKVRRLSLFWTFRTTASLQLEFPISSQFASKLKSMAVPLSLHYPPHAAHMLHQLIVSMLLTTALPTSSHYCRSGEANAALCLQEEDTYQNMNAATPYPCTLPQDAAICSPDHAPLQSLVVMLPTTC